jgi:hypothetical protein
MLPTMKYWKTLGPVSPPLLLYAANDGILVVSAAPLKGLSNDEAEALRVCRAVQPALATGNWWAVHERAIARVVLARAGIVDGGCGWLSMDGSWWCYSDVEVLEGAWRVAAATRLYVACDWLWPLGENTTTSSLPNFTTITPIIFASLAL